jgi:hypothetical protein
VWKAFTLDVFHFQVFVVRVVAVRFATSFWGDFLILDVLVLDGFRLVRHVQHGLILGLEPPIVGGWTSLDQITVFAEDFFEVGLWLIEILLKPLGRPEAVLAELLDDEICQYVLVDARGLELLRLVFLLRLQVQEVFGGTVDADSESGPLAGDNLQGLVLFLA